MRSISIRFALAAVTVAMIILALIGAINYHYLKEELLRDATEKTRLIEQNSVHQIHYILTQTEETSKRISTSTGLTTMQQITSLLGIPVVSRVLKCRLSYFSVSHNEFVT